MAVKYVGPGENTTFLGFCVRKRIDGKDYHAWFSTKDCDRQQPSDPLFRSIQEQANQQDAQWEAISRQIIYQRTVSESSRSTHPGRGSGVSGISLNIQDGRGVWHTRFVSALTDKDGKRRTVRARFRSPEEYLPAWNKVVEQWAKAKGILPEDKEATLNSPPCPCRFRQLREQLLREGRNVPSSVLQYIPSDHLPNCRGESDLPDANAIESDFSETLGEPFHPSPGLAGLIKW